MPLRALACVRKGCDTARTLLSPGSLCQIPIIDLPAYSFDLSACTRGTDAALGGHHGCRPESASHALIRQLFWSRTNAALQHGGSGLTSHLVGQSGLVPVAGCMHACMPCSQPGCKKHVPMANRHMSVHVHHIVPGSWQHDSTRLLSAHQPARSAAAAAALAAGAARQGRGRSIYPRSCCTGAGAWCRSGC